MRRNARVPRLLYVLALLVAGTFFCVLKTDLPRAFVQKSTTTSTQTTPAPVSLASLRHVTKSLDQLGSMDELNSHVVFFNRVSKSGSEMLVLLLQWLQGWNSFKHVRMRSRRKRKLSRLEQETFVEEVQNMVRREAVPLSFDGDIYFVNFTSFDKQSPTYINLIRDPADKIISRYYTELAEENYPIQSKEGMTFENCLKRKYPECSFKEEDLTVPYFCGHDKNCRRLNDKAAVKRAMKNVERYYSVVGVLEELNTTLAVFENRMPYFFKGVRSLYYKDLLRPFRNRRTKKYHASYETRAYLRRLLVNEYEFYEWIKRRLFGELQVMSGEHSFH